MLISNMPLDITEIKNLLGRRFADLPPPEELPAHVLLSLNALQNRNAINTARDPEILTLSSIGFSDSRSIGMHPMQGTNDTNRAIGRAVFDESMRLAIERARELEGPDGEQHMASLLHHATIQGFRGGSVSVVFENHGKLVQILEEAVENLHASLHTPHLLNENLQDTAEAICRTVNSKPLPYPQKTVDALLELTFLDRAIPIPSGDAQKEYVAVCSGTAMRLHENTLEILLAGDAKSVLIPEGYFDALSLTPYYTKGGSSVIIPTKDDGYKLTAQKLEETIRAAPEGTYACLVITNPTNPIGLAYGADELKAIGKVAVQNGLTIIMDEHFAGLHRPEKPATVSLASLSVEVGGKEVRLFDHSLTIQGSSKILDYELEKMSLAASGNTALIRAMQEKIKEHEQHPTSREAASILAIASVIEPNQMRNDIGDDYGRLKQAVALANNVAGKEVFSLLAEPEGGFFAVVTMNPETAKMADIRSHQDFYTYTLLTTKVKGRPMEGMGFKEDDGIIGMRINYTCPGHEKLVMAFARMGAMAHGILEGKAPRFDEMRGTSRFSELSGLRAAELLARSAENSQTQESTALRG